MVWCYVILLFSTQNQLFFIPITNHTFSFSRNICFKNLNFDKIKYTHRSIKSGYHKMSLLCRKQYTSGPRACDVCYAVSYIKQARVNA